MSAGTSTTERPQWRDYWAAAYEYYTVLGCEWKLTISNTQTTRTADVVIAYDTNSFTDAAGATGNRTPSTSIKEMLAFKEIKWAKVHAPNQYEDQAKPNTIVITGSYKPGTIRHNIRNDGDVKTWTSTDTTLPTGS